MTDTVAGQVRVLDHRPVSRQAALHLQRSIAYVRDSVMADPEAARAPLVVSTATQYLAASVLHAFPSSVAYRWGFSSPSRFAACYRATYGVPPSDTLHR